MNDNLTPKAIVRALDEHIVGQSDAKKAVAVALRNRWRRQRLPLELRDDWREDVFRKALLNASLGSMCAVTRHCMGCVMGQPEARAMVEDMLREGMAICSAEGIELAEVTLNQPA